MNRYLLLFTVTYLDKNETYVSKMYFDSAEEARRCFFLMFTGKSHNSACGFIIAKGEGVEYIEFLSSFEDTNNSKFYSFHEITEHDPNFFLEI